MAGFDWDDLRVVLALWRGRSIRAAARRLNVSHSTISRRLEGLERRLDAKLFQRTADGLVATSVGERLAARAEHVEAELHSIEREVLGSDSALEGEVRLSLPPVFAQKLLVAHLKRFCEAHPRIRLHLVNTYDLSDLSRREADIAVRFSRDPGEALVGRRLPDFADAIYSSQRYTQEHTFTGRDPTARWIGWGEPDLSPKWLRASPFPDCAIGWQIDDPLTQVAAAKDGVGMALLPCWLGDAEPGLVRVPPGQIVRRHQGWVLMHAELKRTARMRCVARFLSDAVRHHEPLVTGAAPAAAP